MGDSTPPRFIGAVPDEWVMYSNIADDYTVLSPIGFGASSVVYQAIYHHKEVDGVVKDIPCAMKVLNLDKLPPSAMPLLTRETQLMSLSKHPNVIRVRGTWMIGYQLYIAMRLMNKGSVADIMKYSFIDGLSEEVVKCILYQALQGLNYLHVNGFIHRDVKAANLLVDDDGTVLLGDLGVAVSLTDDGTRDSNTITARKGLSNGAPLVYGAPAQPKASKTDEPAKMVKKRNSFVGTPSWMAPEVIAQQHYDSSADVWSLGITVIEMCHGRAPNSRERDVKRVLLNTLQNAPPTLDRDNGRSKYSKALKDFVDCCLVKDPEQRPTAEKLLKHDIFKNVKKPSYLVSTLLASLPPLADRQERQLVNPPKHKPHPLAIGSPSLTSIQTRHSWDWNFSTAPGSPRSTIYSKPDANTPPGSIRSPTRASDHPHDEDPSSSQVELLHREGRSVTGVPRSRSRSGTGASAELRGSSISPTRLRNHSRVPSYVPSHLEPDVEEAGEGEDDMKAIDAQLEKLGLTPNRDVSEPDEEILATPHVHAADEDDPTEDPEALVLQDRSSSASSASQKNSPSIKAKGSLDNDSAPTTPSTSPNKGEILGSPPAAPAAQPLKQQSPPLISRATSASQASSTGTRSKLWAKVKSAASSSKRPQTGVAPPTPTEEIPRKSSLSNAKLFLLERTRSATGR